MSSNERWLQLTIECDRQIVDPLSDYLVGVLEAAVEVGIEDQLIDESLHAFLQESNPTDERVVDIVEQVEIQAKMLAAIFQVKEPVITHTILEDQDWGSNWKKHFKPFAITSGLVIKPSWEDYNAKESELVIEMDPGMAFGTGHHATTSLCMDYIRSVIQENPGKVLDVGTGTGILAMAAALFGAENVVGIDNDPDAVAAACENVAHNNLSERVVIDITALNELTGEYSLVVANIIFEVLVMMRDDLTRLTAKGGALVLSGILKEKQAHEIITLYESLGFSCVDKAEKGEWAALHLVKK